MTPFAFLALAIAVVVAGMVAVVIRQLLRDIRGLTAAIRGAGERIGPLSQELSGELAVTALEVDGLSRSVAQVQREHSARPRRSKPRSRR